MVLLQCGPDESSHPHSCLNRTVGPFTEVNHRLADVPTVVDNGRYDFTLSRRQFHGQPNDKLRVRVAAIRQFEEQDSIIEVVVVHLVILQSRNDSLPVVIV